MKRFQTFNPLYSIVLVCTTFLYSCTKEETEKLPALVTEITVTNITATTAQSGGDITDDKGEVVTARGICWSTNNSPTINDSIAKSVSGTVKYLSQMHNLLPNTSYYVRAYATNRFGTAYGDAINFKTLIDSVKITTTAITEITSTTAVGGGIITSDGNGVIVERGICWNTLPNPTIVNYKTTDGIGNGIFNSNLANLTRATTYYVRAYAKNNIGISYGSQVAFNTITELPSVSTTKPSNIGEVTVQVGGMVVDNGGAELVAKGICYSTNHNPSIIDSRTASGSSIGSWVTIIQGFTPSTTYYVRAYATNIVGTSYGDEMAFRTLNSPYSSGTTTDIDGNVYKTINIGNQTWMAENLKTTKYSDGTEIPYITSFDSWQLRNTPAFCWPNNEIANKETYGALYNWFTVNTGKLAPNGWHIATIDDWITLKTYLSNNNYYFGNNTSNIAKSLASSFGWNNSTVAGSIGNDMSVNNRSLFNAVPSGTRDARRNFTPLGFMAIWWTPNISYATTASYAYNLSLTYDQSSLSVWDTSVPQYGYAVRCVKD
jgi:uncharacterized protein (TIGR02145 family)